MSVSVSITVNDVKIALGNFMTPLVSGAAIVMEQVNRVSPPPSPYVAMNEISNVPLTRSYFNNNPETLQVDITGPSMIGIQCDFFGATAGDLAKTVVTCYRTPYATAMFPDGIKPLYCSDARQLPLITGEEQYETRWTFTAFIQYNPVVSIDQQSAIALKLNILEDVQ